MFWAIIRVVQIILWFCTFFLAKKIKIEVIGKDFYSTNIKTVETNERYKFPLWMVLLGLLLNLVPILGLIATIVFTIIISNMKDCEFDEERPSFFLVKLFTKKI